MNTGLGSRVFSEDGMVQSHGEVTGINSLNHKQKIGITSWLCLRSNRVPDSKHSWNGSKCKWAREGVFPNGPYMSTRHLLCHSWTNQQSAEGFWTGHLATRGLNRVHVEIGKFLFANARESPGALFPKTEYARQMWHTASAVRGPWCFWAAYSRM